MASFEFYFDFTSTYSYLASTQVESIASRSGAKVDYRPFLLGAVFQATGNSPPLSVPAKGLYLFKDLRDWTRRYGLPEFQMPPSFPLKSIRANRLALVAIEEGRIADFVGRTYRAAFVEHRDLANDEVLAELARASGLDPEAALARIETQEIKDLLRKNTDGAVARGAFGAPTFFVGEEMFVGNDRISFVEAALGATRVLPADDGF